MTALQRLALRAMSDRNLGALVTRYGWTWPHHVRESEEVAKAVLDALLEAGWEDSAAAAMLWAK